MRKALVYICLLVFTIQINAQDTSATKSKNNLIYEEYKSLVQSGSFVFNAEWVMNASERKALNSNDKTLSFANGIVSGQLEVIDSNKKNLNTTDKCTYGEFYSDESQLIKLVFTSTSNNSIESYNLEIKNGKVFLRIVAKEFADLVWVGKLSKS